LDLRVVLHYIELLVGILVFGSSGYLFQVDDPVIVCTVLLDETLEAQ
jgi:hypothetical protein